MPYNTSEIWRKGSKTVHYAPPFYNTEPPLGGLWYKTMKGWGSFTNDVSLTTSVSQETRRRGKAEGRSQSHPLRHYFSNRFSDWYGKVMKTLNKFNIFQNDLRTGTEIFR
jgi:hypothetical protein